MKKKAQNPLPGIRFVNSDGRTDEEENHLFFKKVLLAVLLALPLAVILFLNMYKQGTDTWWYYILGIALLAVGIVLALSACAIVSLILSHLICWLERWFYEFIEEYDLSDRQPKDYSSMLTNSLMILFFVSAYIFAIYYGVSILLPL